MHWRTSFFHVVLALTKKYLLRHIYIVSGSWLYVIFCMYLFRSRFLGGWSAAARSEIEILFFDWKRFCKINHSFENNLAIRVCFHFCCVKLRRRPHSPCYAPTMLCVHTTPEKFLITQQSLIILGLCLRKIRAGKLHCFRKHGVQNVFRQHRHNAKRRLDFRRSLVSGLPSPRSWSAFGGGARAHFPNSGWLWSLRKAAFSNFSGLKSFSLRKLHLNDELVCIMRRPNHRDHVSFFQISPA